MGLFSNFRKKNNVEQRQFFPYINEYFNSGLFAVEKNNCVDRAVSLISGTIASLPIELYQYTKRGVMNAWSNPIAKLLKDPAVEETPQLFYRTLVRHMIVKGNAYVFKHRNSKGEVVCLELIDPNRVMVRRTPDGRKMFDITGGERGGIYTERDVIQFIYPDDGFNGTIGMSPFSVHSDVVKSNFLLQEYIAVTFDRGIGSRFLISLDKDKFPPGSAKLQNLIQEFQEYFQRFVYTQQNSHKPILTPPGSTISTIDMPDMVKSSVVDLYNLSCKQVYGILNIPYEVVESSANKYNSLEQRNRDFLNNVIHPLCLHIGQTFAKALLDPADYGIFFVSYDYNSFLETDTEKKVNSLVKQFQSGVLSLNEVRERLHLQSLENEVEGNTRWVPSNLVPLTESNIDSYLAAAKLKMKEADNLTDDVDAKIDEGHAPTGLDKVLG